MNSSLLSLTPTVRPSEAAPSSLAPRRSPHTWRRRGGSSKNKVCRSRRIAVGSRLEEHLDAAVLVDGVLKLPVHTAHVAILDAEDPEEADVAVLQPRLCAWPVVAALGTELGDLEGRGRRPRRVVPALGHGERRRRLADRVDLHGADLIARRHGAGESWPRRPGS